MTTGDVLAAPFVLMSLERTLVYFNHVYWFVHVGAVLLFVFTIVVPSPATPTPKSDAADPKKKTKTS
jgi:hypothetical protein